ncbi:MAG TPA: oligosaccharide flippase family protein [Candidatus Saccharimonadales bacterium]|nr:oligosaccharide flippase family protein [Candidatus Saccharimonadales bacterium]
MFRSVLTAVRSSSFVRHNAIFFFGSVAVGVLNYVYYPILGRMLSVEAYGEVQALVSLFLQMLVFLVVMSQVTINVVANYTDEDKKRRVVYELEKLALVIALAMLVIVAIFAVKLRTFFQFDSTWPFIAVMAALAASVPLTFRSAYLRGRRRFGMTALANLLGAAGKILFSTILVWIGWSTFGAVIGIVIAQLLAFGYAAYCAKKIGFEKPEGVTFKSLPSWSVLRPEMKYGLFVLVGSLTITVLASVDIFIVKHYFDAETAGQYAGISTVARMIFFLTMSVAQVLLPSVRIELSQKENRQYLLKSLALVTVLGGTVLLVFTVFSANIVRFLMGNSFSTYTHLLPALSLAMFIISILNLIVSYYIALRRYQISAIVALGAIITGGLLIADHQTLAMVVNSLLYGSASMLGLFVVWFAGRIVTKQMRKGL